MTVESAKKRIKRYSDFYRNVKTKPECEIIYLQFAVQLDDILDEFDVES